MHPSATPLTADQQQLLDGIQIRLLEAKRFAATGRQQRERVLARERVADDFLLQRAEGGEAEVLLQQREQFWSGGFHSCKNMTGTLEFKL